MYEKITYFLDSQDKKKIFYLFGLFILVGLIEVAGVLSIMPFVGMITDPNYFGSNQLSIYVKEYLSITNRELTLLFGILFVILFVSCSFLNGLTVWLNTRLMAILGEKISSRLFNHYLKQPYDFFTKNDLSSLSKNMIQVSVSLAESIFIPALQILTRLIILIFVSILLININPIAFIYSLLLIGLIYIFIFKFIKVKLTEYGKERLISNDLLFKSTSDCLNSIKDVKFYRVEDFFNDIFSKSQRKFLDLTARNIIISILPRYIIEIVAFGSIFTTLLYLQYNNFNLAQYAPTIALFVLAAYRLLPSFQQIFAYSSTIRFNLPALELIYNDMHTKNLLEYDYCIKDIDDKIIFNNINYSYEKDIIILNNINFKISNKSYTAIIGASGSGKTTMVDLLLGLYKPNSGNIVLSKTLYDAKFNKLLIGYVSQNSPFINDTIRNNIAFGVEENDIDEERILNLIDICCLSNLLDMLPDKIHTRIGEKGSRLSGGQLQRIGIARALYRNPNLLILDEATNALDVTTEKNLFQSLKSNLSELSVICITHRLSAMKECDNIFHLNNGYINKLSDSNNSINEIELNKLAQRYNKND